MNNPGSVRASVALTVAAVSVCPSGNQVFTAAGSLPRLSAIFSVDGIGVSPAPFAAALGLVGFVAQRRRRG